METYARTFTVEDLRRRLDAGTYPRFRSFDQRVLKPAVREVNTYTDAVRGRAGAAGASVAQRCRAPDFP